MGREHNRLDCISQTDSHFIHIRDISRGELAAALHGQAGGLYHLSPERGHAVRDIVRRICELTGNDFDTSTLAVAERPGQDAAYVIRSTRAREELGWSPRISIDDGLTGVVDWVNENWEEIQGGALEYVHQP